VVVVGGGDTGTDCVGTAIRRGAKSVSQFEIMPELPSVRTKKDPWPLWPRLKKTDYGQEEAIALFGADPREYLTTVKEIVGTNEKVSGVRTVKVEWVSEGGKLIPKELPGTEEERPADIVLTAMGFTGPEKTLIDQLGMKPDPQDTYATNIPAVFSCGDMRRGPSLVVWAIKEGQNAATRCHEYLSGRM
jgi:glutamate synthase (NADPH/NADH) small chain